MAEPREPLISTGLYEMQFDGPALADALTNAGAYLAREPDLERRVLGGTVARDEMDELFLSLLLREPSPS